MAWRYANSILRANSTLFKFTQLAARGRIRALLAGCLVFIVCPAWGALNVQYQRIYGNANLSSARVILVGEVHESSDIFAEHMLLSQFISDGDALVVEGLPSLKEFANVGRSYGISQRVKGFGWDDEEAFLKSQDALKLGPIGNALIAIYSQTRNAALVATVKSLDASLPPKAKIWVIAGKSHIDDDSQVQAALGDISHIALATDAHVPYASLPRFAPSIKVSYPSELKRPGLCQRILTFVRGK